MKTLRNAARLASVGGLALTTAALVAGPAAASPFPHHHGHDAPVFVETDGLAGNAVVAYDRDDDGTLTQDGVYPTGGLGGQLTGSVVDHTASQGALAYDRVHGLLYAVNAGTDTITVFEVRGDTLIRRQTLSSGGNFPVSVAFHGDLVYVLNARSGASVQGYLRLGSALIRIPSWNRSLGLDPTLTPEFTHTPGQVVFSPDGSKLLVSTKGNTNAIDVFSVGLLGGLSATPVVNVDTAGVPFALAFDARGHLVVAETGSNAVGTYTVNRDSTLTFLTRVATGQAATCWVAASGNRLYASNAGSASVTGLVDNADGSLASLGNTATDKGTVDAAASSDGRFLYVQAGAAGNVDEFAIAADGSLTAIASVLAPDGVGAEGIAAG
jgi:6-phosphogluconolactonase (cycloisomerase 2 family)